MGTHYLFYLSKYLKVYLICFLLSNTHNVIFAQTTKPQTNWKLVWADEFDYTGLPDKEKWSYDTAGNQWGWGNQEAQFYTHANHANAWVSDGILKITALQQKLGGKNYTSARLITKGKGDWLYGRIEVKAKVPGGKGTWPAIWMLPSLKQDRAWPAGGEIDIMEYRGAMPDSVLSTIHTTAFNHTKGTQKGKAFYLPEASEKFEIYSVEWNEQELLFFVGDTEIFRYENDGNGSDSWPFNKPFHLILNLAIGGTFGGIKGIDPDAFPSVFEIDYVRVYQQDNPDSIIQRPTSGLTIIEAAPSATENMDKQVYHSAKGLISMQADKFLQATGWRRGNYYTGKGMLSQKEPHDTVSISYDLLVHEPGNYKIYVLGNRQRNTPVEHNVIEAMLTDGFNHQSHLIQFNDLNAPSWTPYNTIEHPFFAIVKPGRYTMKVTAKTGGNIYVEKIILSSNGYIPTGTGIAPIFSKDENPASTGFDSLVVLPPHWAFGVLYGSYTNQQETEDVVEKLRQGNFPVDAFWIDSWFWDYSNKGKGPGGYINFIGDTSAFPNKAGLWQKLKNQQVKGGIWIWDCIHKDGNEEIFDEFEKQGFFKNTFINKDRWHNKNGNALTGNIDFDNPVAVAAWHKKLKPLFEEGVDFLKLDRSSTISFTKAAFEATQQFGKETGGRGFVLAHLHSTYDPRFKMYPTKWTGDAKIAWSQPDYPNNGIYAMGAYKDNVEMIADPKRSTYEIPFLTHDAGGYDYFGSTEQSDELYMRWIQFASLNSIMTIFSQHTNPTKNLPYLYPKAVQDNFKKYTHLRMRLFPYIYTQALQTRLNGIKMIQGDGIHINQYLLGPHLLIAPVVEKGVTSRKVYLSEGLWYEYESGKTHVGGKIIDADAPLERIPLFVKAGAIIPLRQFAQSIEEGSNDTLTLQVFTGANNQSLLLEDDGISNDYLLGEIGSTTFSYTATNNIHSISVSAIKGNFKGNLKKRNYVFECFGINKKPKSVTKNNKKIPFEYNEKNKTLRWEAEIPTSTEHIWVIK